MRIFVVIVSCLLWVWFLGCTITWHFGKVLLVEGMGIRSPEFIALLLYSTGIIFYLVWEPIGIWVLLIELLLWTIVQFFCHEYFTILGASPRKIEGYNKCFEGSLKLFPVSKTRLVPDFYHVVLHSLIVLDLVLVVAAIFE